MAITDTPTEVTEQNSILNNIIGKFTGWFSGDSEYAQSNLDLNGIFMLLKNSRRRAIIHLLSDADEEIGMSELVERLAAAEGDVDRSDLSSEDRKRVYVSCYQTHLPKLEEYNVVSVDDDWNAITASKNLSTLVAVVKKTSAMSQ